MRFQQTHTQGLAAAVFDSVLGPPRQARHTKRCPCFSVVSEARQEVSQGPLLGAVLAQNNSDKGLYKKETNN